MLTVRGHLPWSALGWSQSMECQYALHWAGGWVMLAHLAEEEQSRPWVRGARVREAAVGLQVHEEPAG